MAGQEKPTLPKGVWPALAQQLRLTDREAAVVEGLFAGDSELAIALRLGISFHTVHTYVGRVYRKLAVTTRGELLLSVFATYVTTCDPPAAKPAYGLEGGGAQAGTSAPRPL